MPRLLAPSLLGCSLSWSLPVPVLRLIIMPRLVLLPLGVRECAALLPPLGGPRIARPVITSS